MKKQYFKLIILLFIFSYTSSYTQGLIIRRMNNFILIDTDKNIGSVGGEISIYSNSQKPDYIIGKAQIIKFKNGQTAAKIIYESESHPISLNDFIKIKLIEMPATNDIVPRNSSTSNTYENNIQTNQYNYTQSNQNSYNSQPTKSVQCSAYTKKGNRCKRMTTNPNGRCWQHQ